MSTEQKYKVGEILTHRERGERGGEITIISVSPHRDFRNDWIYFWEQKVLISGNYEYFYGTNTEREMRQFFKRKR